MSKIRKIVCESINKATRTLNGIMKQVSEAERYIFSNAESYESIKTFIIKLCSQYSYYFDDLPKDQQEEVCQRLYDRLSGKDAKKEAEEDNNSLEQQIYNYLKDNGSIMYPLQDTSKRLAAALKSKK